VLHLIRTATIHPFRSRFTIGGLPLVIVGYAIAVRCR
jgi:hypothetical protein